MVAPSSWTHLLPDLFGLSGLGQEAFLKRRRLPRHLLLQAPFFALEQFDFILRLDKGLLQPGGETKKKKPKRQGPGSENPVTQGEKKRLPLHVFPTKVQM